MKKRDYYDVLNLNNSCTPQEVKKNFHKLALVWHPDKHSNKSEAEGKFKEIHEAYCVLMDENKRKIYDTLGHSGLSDTLEKRNCTPFNPANFCSQSAFGKSKKSPFEMFCNIFKDKEDEEEDDFYKSFFDCDRRNMCNLINNNIKSFFEEAFESSENEESDQFFSRYKPTFMDTDFFSTPSLFKTFECESELSSSELFSSFFQSAGSATQSFSRTSTTFANGKGNCKTSIKQRFQNGDKVFENEQQYEFKGNCAGKSQEKNCLNNKRTAKPVTANKNKDFILIEDSDNEEEASNNNKDTLKGSENIPNRRTTSKTCPYTNTQFNFDFMNSDDDFNLLFSNMERLGTCRKSKK